MSVVEVDQPPASSVRRFLALLEQSDIDFSEELGKICNTVKCPHLAYFTSVLNGGSGSYTCTCLEHAPSCIMVIALEEVAHHIFDIFLNFMG